MLKFQVKIAAVGEVRDKDGNLISSEPIEEVMYVTEEELAELNVPTRTEEK